MGRLQGHRREHAAGERCHRVRIIVPPQAPQHPDLTGCSRSGATAPGQSRTRRPRCARSHKPGSPPELHSSPAPVGRARRRRQKRRPTSANPNPKIAATSARYSPTNNSVPTSADIPQTARTRFGVHRQPPPAVAHPASPSPTVESPITVNVVRYEQPVQVCRAQDSPLAPSPPRPLAPSPILPTAAARSPRSAPPRAPGPSLPPFPPGQPSSPAPRAPRSRPARGASACSRNAPRRRPPGSCIQPSSVARNMRSAVTSCRSGCVVDRRQQRARLRVGRAALDRERALRRRRQQLLEPEHMRHPVRDRRAAEPRVSRARRHRIRPRPPSPRASPRSRGSAGFRGPAGFARNWASRRALLVPTVDPGFSPRKVAPLAATSASRGSSRSGTAATMSPSGRLVGRSL